MRQDFHGDTGQVAGEKIVNRGGNTHLELNIQGDNYGAISLGWQDEREARPTVHSASKRELNEALSYWRSKWWSGFWGYWLNIPCAVMLMLVIGMSVGLYTGVLLTHDPQSLWMVLVPTMAAILGCGIWLNNIRRIEAQLMAESRAAMDAIKAELRRRR